MTTKNNPVEILTGGTVTFVKICNNVWKRTIHYHIKDSEKNYSESSQVFLDHQEN